MCRPLECSSSGLLTVAEGDLGGSRSLKRGRKDYAVKRD